MLVFSLHSPRQNDLITRNRHCSIHLSNDAYPFIVGKKESKTVSNTIDCLFIIRVKLYSCFSHGSFQFYFNLIHQSIWILQVYLLLLLKKFFSSLLLCYLWSSVKSVSDIDLRLDLLLNHYSSLSSWFDLFFITICNSFTF
jgi:hypothetical protein